MYKSKVIEVFQSFNKAEKIGLRRWVYSPIHNQHKDVSKLIDYLLSRRKITPTSVQRERVFKHLYPSCNYNRSRLNHVLSFSLEVLEEYIRHLMSKKNTLNGYFLLHQYYQDRNMPHLAKKALNKAELELSKNPYLNEQYYHNSFLLEQATFDWAGTEGRQQQTNLQAIFTDLATFTIISTLRNACTAISHKNLYQINYKVPFLDAILAEASTPAYDKDLVVRSYYHSYMALANPQEENHFKILKDLLINQKVPLATKELKHICLLAINYCIKRLNTGAETYVQEVFDIYCLGLDRQIWIEKGHLSHNTFKNIATAALRLKAYDWTNSFIEKYSTKIKISHQKDYTNYVKAKLFFEQNKFSQALSILIETDPIDLFIGLAIKTLLLKIYWKLEEYDLLEAHLDNFSVYLNRKKVLAYHRKIYGNTISITRKIISANLNDLIEREHLKQLIIDTHPLTERPWLLAQIT